MNTKKRYLAIVLSLVLLMSSSVVIFGEESNNNLYPNPYEDLLTIQDQMLMYEDQYVYSYGDITINGPSVQGSVMVKQGNDKGKAVLYTLEVKEEGMVSINLETSSSADKDASLFILLGVNDPRTTSNSVGNNMDVQTTLYDRANHYSVQQNRVYYAYPGFYYFLVRGFDKNADGDKALSFAISATQEVYPEQFGDYVVNTNHSDYPNFLGDIILEASLDIKGTKAMKNWRKPTASGGLSGGYTNSADKFTFTATTTGTIYSTLTNHQTTILDTYLAAHHSQVKSTTFAPKITVSIKEMNVGYPLRTEVEYGQVKNDTFEVEEGVTYNVEIGGSNHPMNYSLYLSYAPGVVVGGGTTSASSWALDEINQSINAGLKTTKMMNNDYKSYATREEFAELVMKLYDQLGGASVSSGDNPFVDTTNTEIVRARNAGIINGTSATTFGPSANLTREQLCVMILRALEATDTSYNTNVNFQKTYSDTKDISSWALDSVRVLNSYKIINGSGEGLDPKSTVTKEVAILMLYRAYELFK